MEMQDAGDPDEYTRDLARRFYTSREESWKGRQYRRTEEPYGSLMSPFYRDASAPEGAA